MNIYALSSGRGPSGIAIIRLSGKDALNITELITKEKKTTFKELNLSKFYDPSNNTLIDEGLILSFPGPNSFTGDDLVEFHVHGSNAVIIYFLKVLSEQDNCRLAEAGEFTKIAFQNNKIDLIEAESIGDLIHSETEMQRIQALKLVQGNASNYYNVLREKLIKSLAYIEAKIDFAEDDLPESVLKEVQESIKEVHFDIKKILEDHKVGEKIRDGFKVSIVGEVNAGKSSLLNLLSKRNAAIVSAQKGTTRDVIEVYLNIDGYPVILADTAGIRDSQNEIEKKGISLAISRSRESDLSLIMIDNSSKTIDPKILNLINKDCIVVLNKSDINSKQNHNFSKAQVATRKITLIEGQTIQEYYQLLSQNPALTSQLSFEKVLRKTTIKAPYDGKFWPDTYKINYADSVLSVLNRSHALLQEKLSKAWNDKAEDLLLKNADQALILASLIEKETANDAEKSKIAGVFMNRLKVGMRLQTDLTVAYALGDAYTGKLNKKDLWFKSPYNTYRHKGLPPGAIGSVGLESLRAATHPLKSDYLYFVAKKDGTHAFAKTYKQHLINIKKYLK